MAVLSNRDFTAACLSSVELLLSQLEPGNIVTRNNLERQRDEFRADLWRIDTEEADADSPEGMREETLQQIDETRRMVAQHPEAPALQLVLKSLEARLQHLEV